jgi:hypothetical protein
MSEKTARVVGDNDTWIEINAQYSVALPPQTVHNPRGGEPKRQPLIVCRNSRTVGRIGASDGRGKGKGASQGRDRRRRRGCAEVLLFRQGEKHAGHRGHVEPTIQEGQGGAIKSDGGNPVVLQDQGVLHPLAISVREHCRHALFSYSEIGVT